MAQGEDSGRSIDSVVPFMDLPERVRPVRASSMRRDSVDDRLTSLAVMLTAPTTKVDYATDASDDVHETLLHSRLVEIARMGSMIKLEDLKHVRKLGEGGFATVDLMELDVKSELIDKRSTMDAGGPRVVRIALKQMKTHLPSHTHPLETGPPCAARRVPDKWVTNFLSEGVLMGSLSHPNVVRCYGSVEVETTGFSSTMLHFALEVMPGGTLRDRVSKGNYDVLQALEWLIDICKGMAYFHDAAGGTVHVAHRDLKPENVLLSETGRAKIADLGLFKFDLEPDMIAPPAAQTSRANLARLFSKSMMQQRQPGHLTARPITSTTHVAQPSTLRRGGSMQNAVEVLGKKLIQMTGARASTGMTGSLMFMAPENFLNKPYNGKVDVFSFGILAFEVLARGHAYDGLFLLPDQVAHAVAKRGLRPKIPRSWPREVSALLESCWAEDPEMRPDFADLELDLTRMLDGAQQDPEWFSAFDSWLQSCCGGRRKTSHRVKIAPE